jgi:hypothetical protein
MYKKPSASLGPSRIRVKTLSTTAAIQVPSDFVTDQYIKVRWCKKREKVEANRCFLTVAYMRASGRITNMMVLVD